ncbi:MAG: hypothetical protein HYU56_01405 [Candidatus Aenigmarchaeota archaeon]|nr:hypothetical protein [Candidatus Aenigmarchaeota archaeon]
MARDTFYFGHEGLVAEPVQYAARRYKTSALTGKRHGPSLAERISANPNYATAAHWETLNGQEMSFSPQARNSEAHATVKQALAIAAEKTGRHSLFGRYSF